LAGKWIGVDASGVKVSVAPEFGILNDDPNPIEGLRNLGLSEEDLIAELKRRGLVSEHVKSLDMSNQETAPPNNNDLETPNNQ